MKQNPQIDEYGTKRWFNEAGILHRIGVPAIEWSNKSKSWYQNGDLHRTDGPAIEYDDGSKVWYLNGKRHRADGPAIEWSDGSKEWWFHDIRAKDEAQFYDPTWRKSILLKVLFP